MKFTEFLNEGQDENIIKMFKAIEAKDNEAQAQKKKDPKKYLDWFYEKHKAEIDKIEKRFGLDADHLGALLMDMMEE